MNLPKEEFSILMPFSGQKEDIEIKIVTVPDKDPLIAFAQIDFGFLRIKGCTIKWKDFGKGDGPILVFDLPAYKTAFKYVKAVYFPDTEQYKKMTDYITSSIQERMKLYEIGVFRKEEEEEVNIDDIPF